MSKYIVTCTAIYNGSVEVEAASEEEAIEAARELIDEGEVEFQFGESTADYAELAK